MKTPALETPASFDGASTEMLPNDKRGESTQPSQHLHSSPMMVLPQRDNDNNKCLLLNLPDEALMEIAAFLVCTRRVGGCALPGYQIIFPGFKRVRRLTVEQIPLIVSNWSRQPGQLMTSTGSWARSIKSDDQPGCSPYFQSP